VCRPGAKPNLRSKRKRLPWTIHGDEDNLNEMRVASSFCLPQKRPTWTDSSGEKFEATFSWLIAGTVKLINHDGTVIKVPLDKLSEEDQDWVKNRKR